MNRSFLIRFLGLFATVFAALFFAVWFYLSVTQPADAAGVSPQDAAAMTFAHDDLVIEGAGGERHPFRVELAVTPRQQQVGLMHRDHLADGHGMLFVYDPPRRISMWMKNTRIALDMVFAGGNGTVFYVHENAQPMSTALITPPGAVKYVLELPAGTIKAEGIAPGDRLRRGESMPR